MYKLFFLIIFSIIGVGLSFFAVAAGFQIAPMSLSLSAKKPIDSLSLINHTEQTLVVRTELVDWHKTLNKDSNHPTHDAVVSPPIAIVLPNSTQVFRVGLLQPESSIKKQESYFHLYLTPVVAQPKALRKNITIQTRIGIPVYLTPIKPVAQVVTEQMTSGKKSVQVTLRNIGNIHTRIQNVSVLSKNSKQVLGEKNDINENIFPGESKELEIPLNGASKTDYDIKVLTSSTE